MQHSASPTTLAHRAGFSISAHSSERRVITLMEIDPAGQYTGPFDNRPAPTACLIRIVRPAPRELDDGLAFPLGEAAVCPTPRRNEAELAHAVLIELDIRGAEE